MEKFRGQYLQCDFDKVLHVPFYCCEPVDSIKMLCLYLSYNLSIISWIDMISLFLISCLIHILFLTSLFKLYLCISLQVLVHRYQWMNEQIVQDFVWERNWEKTKIFIILEVHQDGWRNKVCDMLLFFINHQNLITIQLFHNVCNMKHEAFTCLSWI